MQTISHDRREFFVKSFLLAGAAALRCQAWGRWRRRRPDRAAADPPVGALRRYVHLPSASRSNGRAITRSPSGSLPNVEVWHYDSAVGVGITPNPTNYVPDVFNYAWREYGMRVGLWRLADVFDDAGVKATVALNSQVCEVYPKAIEEMKKRGWEFMGHGTTNSTNLAGLDRSRTRSATPSAASSRPSSRRPASGRAAGSAPD